MKATAEKSGSTAQNHIQSERQPFFSKESWDPFFSESIQPSDPFFTPHFIQPKLTIGRPGDKYEVEADAMADQVVQRLEQPGGFYQFEGGSGMDVQPRCTECEEEEKLQKKEDELSEIDEGTERVSMSNDMPEPPDDEDVQFRLEGISDRPHIHFENQLKSGNGNGHSLPDELQLSMGSVFGADFSNVRIHTDSQAVQMNRQLGAQAFTHGSDIYFNEGKYNPDTVSGKHLLAHELTHTVQQGASVQTKRENGYFHKADPDIQAAWYNFNIPFTDYQFDPSLQGIKNAAKITAGAAGDVAGWVKDKAVAIYDKIKNLINSGKDWIVRKWNALKNKISDSLNIVRQIFNGIIHFVKNPLSVITNALLSMDAESIRNGWTSVTNFVLNIWDNFYEMGTGLINSVEQVWGTIKRYAEELFSSVISLSNSRFFKYLPSSLKKHINSLINSLKSFWNSIISTWSSLFNDLKTFIYDAFEEIRKFINRILSFAIDRIIMAIVKFGQLLLFLKDFFSNPAQYLQPLAVRISGYLDGVEAHFQSQLQRFLFKNSSEQGQENQESTNSITTTEIQTDLPDSNEKRSASWSEIGDNVFHMMGEKWKAVKEDPLSIVVNLLWDMLFPVKGHIKDVLKLFDDIKKIVIRPFSASSLQELWTSILRLLDIPILIYNTVVGIIGRSLMLPLLIASFVPHPLVKGIAIKVGFALLGAMIAGEAANISHKILLLRTGLTDEEEKKEAYNSLSDSFIAFAMEVALALFILIVSVIANIVRGVFNFVKSRIIKPKASKLQTDKPKPDVESGKRGETTTRKRKTNELPGDISRVCRIGSLNCAKLPDKILGEVPKYPTAAGYNVSFPKGPFKIRKSALSGVNRSSKQLQRIVLENPKSWSSAFRKALNKANGGKNKVDVAIRNGETTSLKWPIEKGKAWEVHHVKPVSFGGGNNIGNLRALPNSVHRSFTSWWTQVQSRFKSRFTKSEWDALMTDKRNISGSKAAARSEK